MHHSDGRGMGLLLLVARVFAFDYYGNFVYRRHLAQQASLLLTFVRGQGDPLGHGGIQWMGNQPRRFNMTRTKYMTASFVLKQPDPMIS